MVVLQSIIITIKIINLKKKTINTINGDDNITVDMIFIEDASLLF